MLGKQIRMKRRSLGLSLQDLADEIALNGMPITRAALSNYERGKSVPSDAILTEIAKALGTSKQFLLSGNYVNTAIEFFDEPTMIAKQRSELTSYINLCLDSYLTLDKILDRKYTFHYPEPVVITKDNMEQVEEIAQYARQQLRLGEMPIASVIGTLESNGWYVFELAKQIDLKLISGSITEARIPFMGFGDIRSIVVLRHEMLREVARVYMTGPSRTVMDQAAERFASAMLMPKACAYAEFGAKRKALSFHELSAMKQKYGLSRMKITERLEYLGIISRETKDEIVNAMQRTFLLKRNPSQELMLFNEYPEALRMKYLCADVENMLPDEYRDELGYISD